MIIGGASPLVVASSKIAYSSKFGLTVYPGAPAPAITGSEINANNLGGIYSEVPFAVLSNNSFTGNQKFALKIPAVIGTGVSGNTYVDNEINAMFMTGAVDQDTTWPATNSPYVINSLTVNTGNTHIPHIHPAISP